MKPIIFTIARHLVGKNAAHIARKIQTWIGGLIISSALIPWLTATPIDFEVIMPGGIEQVTAGDVADGLNVGEVLSLLVGVIMVWVSRAMSFLRARDLDWAAEWAGLLIGRSVSSLWRAMLTVTSAGLMWLGINGGHGDGLLGIPMVDVIAALIALGAVGLSSSFEDSRNNSVETSPPKNEVPLPTMIKRANSDSSTAQWHTDYDGEDFESPPPPMPPMLK